MDVPLYEIGHNEHYQQLAPSRQIIYLDGHDIGHVENTQKVPEKFNSHIGQCIIAHQGKQEKIK